MQCGLLGEKLCHSYSPQIHGYFAPYNYMLFEKAPGELEAFLRSGQFSGLNVTIPYKKAVIPYLDALTDRARELGAVNTIVRRPDGTLLGHNTDYYGFSSMLSRSGLSVKGKKALVLGSGGASATVQAVLKEKGANVVVISRTGDNHYGNLHLHRDAAIIVNATPVGTYPEVAYSPIELSQFDNLEGVLDLIYNPARTQLLLEAEKRGLIAENGLWMLVAQAKESAQWFTGSPISDIRTEEVYHKMRLQMNNIVLIGMPGCGKSTIGKQLSEKLGKTFVDADAVIEQQTGMSIPEIFSAHGQAYFRNLETDVLANLGIRSGLVIATGGGCVTQPENYLHLHRNSTIVWLERNLHSLPTDGRPLSQAGNLPQMYQARKPLYQAFADITLENNGMPNETVENLIQVLYGEDFR